jgi:ribosomal protein L10
MEAMSGPIVTFSTDREPGEAGQAILSTIKSRKNIHLLAGKIENKIWTHEGCREVLESVPKRAEIFSQILSLLQAPAANLTGAIAQAPSALVTLLHMKSKIEG